MKKMIMLALMSLVFSAYAHATCASKALSIAEDTYGNDPVKTSTKKISGNIYEVTVGMGNDEDGAHNYRVVFSNASCDPQSVQVCDLTQPDSTADQKCNY